MPQNTPHMSTKKCSTRKNSDLAKAPTESRNKFNYEPRLLIPLC
jgi:hypothetical protein